MILDVSTLNTCPPLFYILNIPFYLLFQSFISAVVPSCLQIELY